MWRGMLLNAGLWHASHSLERLEFLAHGIELLLLLVYAFFIGLDLFDGLRACSTRVQQQ